MFRIDDGFIITFEYGDVPEKMTSVTSVVKADNMASAFIMTQERVNKLGYARKRLLSIAVLDGGIISDD